MEVFKVKMKDLFERNEEKIKDFLKIFTIVFALNLFLLSFVNLITNGTETDVFYGGDTPRVLQDMTLHDSLHYRTAVHPLFVILTQPFVWALGKLTGLLVSAIIFEAFVGALSATFFFLLMKKMGLNKKASFLATTVLVLTFSQIAFNSIFETYIFSQLGLMVMWLLTIGMIDKKLELKDYALLVIAGVASLAFTMTNIMQFLILLTIIIFLNKKEKNKLIKFGAIILVVVAITTLLAEVQRAIWPSANNFFTSSLNGFIVERNSEEYTYIEKVWSMKRVFYQMNVSFVYQFALLAGVVLIKNNLINILGIILFSIFGLTNLIYFFGKKKIFKEKLYFGLLAAYGFNFVLHIFYNPYESFLYVLHFNFIIIAILFYIFTHLDSEMRLLNGIKNFCVKYKVQIITSYIFLQLIGIIKFLQEVHLKFGFRTQMSKYIVGLIALSLIIFVALVIKKRWIKFLAIAATVLCCGISWYGFNQYFTNREIKNVEALERAKIDYKPFLKNSYTKGLVNNLADYLYELDVPLRAQVYFVQKFDITDKKKASFFSFGMGDRKKMVYKNGELIDLKTKQSLRKFQYTHEMIIPNEYTVLLMDESGNITRIFEDEDGVHIETGRTAKIWENWNNYYQWEDDRLNNRETILPENIKVETIATGKKKLNLPDFKEQKLGKIMRVLHQEVLTNINEGKPKSTLLAKTNEAGLYREGMVAAMVLEETKNTWLFEDWLKSINSIYDCRNVLEKEDKKCVETADNPGQLLYLLGAVKNNRQDLITKIIKEVKNKSRNGEFAGLVDGEEMGYYPTALLINGALKNNLNIGYDFNLKKTDKYLGLTWWLNNYKQSLHGNINTKEHPAMEWASTHQEPGNYGLTTILDEAYPLTYDGKLSKTEAEEQKLVNDYYSFENGPKLSSIWHASEMLLILMEKQQ